MPDELDDYLNPVPKRRRNNYDDLIEKHARRTNLDPNLVRAVMSQESGGNPRARSHKNAQGLMQLIPATAKRFGVKNIYDPEENVRGGTDYLKFLNDRFKGNRDLVLAGYNAGEGAVDKFKGIPPYKETQNYVRSINKKLGSPRQQKDELDSYLDPIEDYLDKPEQPPPAPPRTGRSGTTPTPIKRFKRDPFAGLKAGAGESGDSWRPASMEGQRKLFEPQQPHRSSIGDMATALPGVHQLLKLLPEEDRENIVEGVTGAVSGTAKQLANTQELGLKYTPYGIAGRKLASQAGLDANRIPQALRGVEHALGQEVAENEAARPAPTTFAGNVRRGVGKGVGAASVELPKLIFGGRMLGAANLPVQGALSRADEGASGIVKGALGGLVYHYGGQLTGKAFSGVSPYLAKAGNSLVWIAGPVAEQQIAAKVTGTEPPNLAQSIGENIPFGIVAGQGARGKVRVKTPRGERDATAADLPKILKKELEVVPPERGNVKSSRAEADRLFEELRKLDSGSPEADAIRARWLPLERQAEIAEAREFFDNGGRYLTQSERERLLGDATSVEEYAANAASIRHSQVRDQGGFEDARQAETQRQGVSPEQPTAPAENIPKFDEGVRNERVAAGSEADVQQRSQLPNQSAIEQQVQPAAEQPQRFYHRDYGKVVKLEDQSGARRGKTKVAEADNPDAIHYVKTAQLTGAGNQRMVPLKPEPKVEPDIEPYLNPSPAQPSEQAAGVPREPSVREAVTKPAASSPTTVELNGRTYTRNERGEWHREDGRIVRGVTEEKLNDLSSQRPPSEKDQVDDLNLVEQRLKQGPLHTDVAAEELGLTHSRMVSALIGLELQGRAKAKPHNMWESVSDTKSQQQKGGLNEPQVPLRTEATESLKPIIETKLSDEGVGRTESKPAPLSEPPDLPQTKVRAPTGEPLKVYHGTASKYEGGITIERPPRILTWDGDQNVQWASGNTMAVKNQKTGKVDLLINGTRKEFDTFEAAKEHAQTQQPSRPVTEREALFFADNPIYARTFAKSYPDRPVGDDPRLMSAYLDLRNPLDSSKPESWEVVRPLVEKYLREEEGGVSGAGLQRIREAYHDGNWAIIEAIPGMVKHLKKQGYDGYISKEGGVLRYEGQPMEEYMEKGGPDRSTVYAVFDPKAIHVSEMIPKSDPRFDELTLYKPPKAEPPPFEPTSSTTAAKREAVTADRAARDLPPIPKPERKADADLLDAAKEANKADPSRPLRLAEEVLRTNRALSDKETVQLDLRQQQLKNEYDRLNKEIAESTDAETIKRRGAESDALESEMNRIEEAWAASGTEKGRALRAQRIAIDQDFRLLTMVSKLKKDKGRDLNPEERSRVEEQHRQIEQLTKQLAEAEERAAQTQLQKQIDKVVRKGRRAETKAALDKEFTDLKAKFAEIRASQGVGAFFKSERGAFDPAAVKVIGEMARNRVKAGTVKAEALVDEIHSFISEHVPDVTKRDVRDAISGYGMEPQSRQRSEAQAQLAKIKSELKQLSASEDIAAGKRLSRQDKMRQTNLLKQEAELQRRMAEKDYSDAPKRQPPQYTRETYEIQKRLEGIKQQYAKDRYKATRSTGGKISDELAKAANIPKTLKSIGDVSAVLRQGGFYSITHPVEGLIKPTKEMIRSFSDMGWRNVEAKIKADADFDTLRKAGVEFTGVDKSDPRLSKHEEGYLGQEYLQYVPVAKQVANFSERTFVSFLDAQRLYIGKQMLKGLTDAQRKNPEELKAIARLINSGTGRGSLGRKGNTIAPALNIAMFSPRLLASRVQLLNNMINPVTIARMPAGARKAMIKDNVKFLAATMATIQLAKMSGATVSLDPDDAEFLKIRFGNTVYDQLTGLQQPLRYIINMGRAATGGDTYPGQDMAEQSKRFARSKLNPALSPVVNFISGEDFMGRKFSAKREVKDLVVPLPANDVIEAMQQEGLIGLPKALPTFVGIGVGSYPPSPDRPTTHAEKLARRFIREKMPDKAREDEEIETDRAKAQARAKSRRGENVSADIAALKGKITPRQVKGILAARNKTRLEEDFAPLGINEATLVYSVADADQQRKLKPLLQKKIPLYYTLLPSQQGEIRERLNSFGIKVGAPRASQ